VVFHRVNRSLCAAKTSIHVSELHLEIFVVGPQQAYSTRVETDEARIGQFLEEPGRGRNYGRV